jgi:penicillin-binding protein 1B
MKAAQLRRSGSEPAPRTPSAWRIQMWFYVRHLCLWALIAVTAYWLWLDHEVTRAFEHKRWALPARVFARPLELYAGAPVTQQRVVRHLERLGYRRVDEPRSAGQFSTSGRLIVLHSRGYRFWDFPEPARRVIIEFAADKRIAAVRESVSAEAVELMRLEPPEIGRVNPHRFEDRALLAYAEVPPRFVEALVAVEDRRFFQHHGIDFMGLARALGANVLARKLVQGGSTLTQQLVKNLYLTRERTLGRKLREALMAVSLEQRYSKQQIIETYINEVFLAQDGNRAIHGFELAARFYFAKPLAELDWPELALLIGLTKGPSAYNPRRHPAAALARRNLVLGVLAEAGLISMRELTALRRLSIELKTAANTTDRDHPAFMALVRRQLVREYSPRDLNAAGLNIFTTLDIEAQEAAAVAVRETIADIEKRSRQVNLQAAIVLLDPASGEVTAMVGDRDPSFAGFNRAVDARRSVGSLLKPFVYAYALSQPLRYSLATPLADVAVNWTAPDGKRWQPRNFDQREHGRVSLLEALTRSLNLATVNLGLNLGVGEVTSYLSTLGVPGAIPQYPSVFLGTLELSPLELAELYTVFANDGFRVPTRVISAVTDQNLRKLNRYGLALRPVMDPATAALMRYALSRVVAEGTARALATQLRGVTPLAGKTGTSNDSRDSWFAGFGTNLLGVAWIGRDDNKSIRLTGSAGGMRLWAAAMRGAGITPLQLSVPADVAWRRVDLDNALELPAHCANGTVLPLHQHSVLPQATDCYADLPSTYDSLRARTRATLERLQGVMQ